MDCSKYSSSCGSKWALTSSTIIFLYAAGSMASSLLKSNFSDSFDPIGWLESPEYVDS